MSNLIPTPRTDKNGRTVIRYMKPEQPAKDTPSLPAPSEAMVKYLKMKANRSEHETMFLLADQELWESLDDDHENMSKASPVLRGYSIATLRRILNFQWWVHGQSPQTFAKNIAAKWTETTANDYMAYVTATGETITDHYADSWQLYELHPSDNNSEEYPEERLSQIIALTEVTNFMQYSGLDPFPSCEHPITKDETAYLHQDDLRAFILNPGDQYKREEITNAIIDHDAFDVERIKAILDTSTPALREGIL